MKLVNVFLLMVTLIAGSDVQEAFPQVGSVVTSPLYNVVKLGIRFGEEAPEDILLVGCYIAAQGNMPLPFTLIVEFDTGSNNAIRFQKEEITLKQCNAKEMQAKVLVLKLLRELNEKDQKEM